MKIHGLLLLDKPVGLSSNAALQRVKRLLGADKAGHGGTLDPLASGLLPVLLGEACKLAVSALEGSKSYRARVRLGVRTSTDDGEGEVLAPAQVAAAAAAVADPVRIEAALAHLRGAIEQVPPVFSALKRDGQPMYRRARAGVTVTLAPRPVTVHALVLERIDGHDLCLEITCSKGTYVRALARDLGERLGCGAHLAALERSAVGRFTLAEAMTLEALEGLAESERRRRLVSLEALVVDWPRVVLVEADAAAFRQGRPVTVAAGAAELGAAIGAAGLSAATGAAGLSTATGAARLAVFCADRLIGLGRWLDATDSTDSAAPAAGARQLAPVRVLV